MYVWSSKLNIACGERGWGRLFTSTCILVIVPTLMTCILDFQVFLCVFLCPKTFIHPIFSWHLGQFRPVCTESPDCFLPEISPETVLHWYLEDSWKKKNWKQTIGNIWYIFLLPPNDRLQTWLLMLFKSYQTQMVPKMIKVIVPSEGTEIQK